MCCVSCVTRASSWYWLTVGQGLLSLQQEWVEGECLISSVSSLSFIFLFLPCPSLSSPLLSLFLLSLWDDTKWPTKVDVSLNPNTIHQSLQTNGLLRRQLAWSNKFYFVGKIRKRSDKSCFLGKIRKIFQNVVYWNFYQACKVLRFVKFWGDKWEVFFLVHFYFNP